MTVWVEDNEAMESERYVATGAYVVLTTSKENATPIFCGVISASRIFRKEGRYAAELTVMSYSWLMDRNKKRISYQKEQRRWSNLTDIILSAYDGIYTWDESGKEQRIENFLMQYEESDWEFLLRYASKQSYPVFPEVRSTGVEVCIGLPVNRDITPIDSVQYRIRSQMNGPCQEDSQKNLIAALEYILEEQYEEIAFGEPVQFMERTLWVVGKQTYLKSGYLLFDYTLRQRESSRVNSWLNKQLAGAAVCGKVTATSSARSKLSLETDGVTESAESWHVQGLYYTGGGAGYSGSPEKGDTQYLYFPTDNEADRYVIGGAGTNYEQIEQTTKSIVSGLEKEQETAQKGTVTEAARQTVLTGNATGGSGTASGRNSGGGTGGSLTPEEVTAVKSWTTPKKQSISLSGEGVRLATGGGISLSLTQAGITVQGKGDMAIEAENIIIVGKQLLMNAKSYIYFKCQGAGIAVLPSAIHILGYRVYLQDNPEKRFEMNNKRESASVVEQVMQEYEERLRGPVPLFAADGSAVRREGFDEFVHTEAQFEYFEENIWGKDERYPNTGGPSYTAYQLWLTDTYGKSTAQKINDVVFSLDSLQVALDVAGFVLPPADLVNAVISLARGKKLDAAIDFVAAVPWLGDQIKYSHMASKIGKAVDGLEFTYKVTNAANVFNAKVAKTLDALDAAMGAKREYQLICDGITISVDARTAAKMLDTASDAISTAKSMAKSADAIDNVLAGGKIINNLSDAGSAFKSGSNVVDTAKAMEGAGEAGKYIYRGKDVSSSLKVSAKILNETGDVISISKSIDLAELAKITGHSVEELTDILKYLGMNSDELASLLKGGILYDILGVSPAKIINSIPYNSYDQMKAAYKGTWTAWSKANKSLGSPNIKKWFDNGGTIILESMNDGSYIWKYTMDGMTASYVPRVINGKLYNVIEFPSQYMHPTKGMGQFAIDGFTGDRAKDMKKAIEYLMDNFDIDEIPDGFILHHDVENGVFQLVAEEIHELFLHYGGHYYNSLK